jgi:tRNA-Thr(GGU) m(6)t(6)A37 methyltransferase TsaA
MTGDLKLIPIGYVRSPLADRSAAPRQSHEQAPAARVEILPEFAQAAEDIRAGDDLWLLTWLHQSRRSTLRVHPRSDPHAPLTGVFSTRSPDRPNPVGLHRVTVSAAGAGWIEVRNLEAIHGTPILDIKPVLADGR